jgi:hypothetical protein
MKTNYPARWIASVRIALAVMALAVMIFQVSTSLAAQDPPASSTVTAYQQGWVADVSVADLLAAGLR